MPDVRQATENVSLYDETGVEIGSELRSLLTALRDSVLRRSDVATVRLDQAATHFVSPTTSLKVEQNRLFLCGLGRLTLTASGHVRATVTNPANSGKTVRIVRLAIFVSAGPVYATVLLNPTTGLPTTQRTLVNAYQGSPVAAVSVIRADTSLTEPLGGGTDPGLVFGLPGGQRTTLDLPPLVLPAGTSIGIAAPFAGAADMTASLYLTEDPA